MSAKVDNTTSSSSRSTRGSNEKMDSGPKSENDAVQLVKASLRDLSLTPRKVALVAALVRGRSVDDALVILAHTPRRAAKPLAKLIASARANATNNHGLKADHLQIETLSVTAGPRLKRYRPVSRGRAHPFQKRTSHVFLTVSGEIKPKKVVGDQKSEVSKDSENQTSDSRKLTTDKPMKEVS